MAKTAALLPFGIATIDTALPGGGLATAALHEIVGSGIDVEFAAAPALFAAGLLARRPGPCSGSCSARICSPPRWPPPDCTRTG